MRKFNLVKAIFVLTSEIRAIGASKFHPLNLSAHSSSNNQSWLDTTILAAVAAGRGQPDKARLLFETASQRHGAPTPRFENHQPEWQLRIFLCVQRVGRLVDDVAAARAVRINTVFQPLLPPGAADPTMATYLDSGFSNP